MMNLRIWLLAGLMVGLIPGGASAATGNQPRPPLSSQAQISVITQWPGAEIYLANGHSAFRVKDPATGLDHVFNYGTFGLEDPLFLAKFVYGELNYYLSEYDYKRYYDFDTTMENRIWEEQVLNLTADQKNRLYQFLAWNARPENAVYLYDFIKDNCSTRIRDALERILGPALHFNETGLAASHETYRAIIDHYVDNRPFYQFLFYIVLGRASDKHTTLQEATFQPFYLEAALDQAQVDRDGSREKLVSNTQRLYEPSQPPNYGTPWGNPAFLLWPLVAIVAFFTIRNTLRLWWTTSIQPSRLPFRLADAVLFGLIGFFGCIVFFLVFFSSHSAVKGNINLIWLWPLHLAAAWFVTRQKTHFWMVPYFGVAAIAALAPLALWPVWPQQLHPSLAPLLLLVFLRSGWHCLRAWHFRRKTGSS